MTISNITFKVSPESTELLELKEIMETELKGGIVISGVIKGPKVEDYSFVYECTCKKQTTLGTVTKTESNLKIILPNSLDSYVIFTCEYCKEETKLLVVPASNTQ